VAAGPPSTPSRRSPPTAYAKALAVVAGCTLACLAMTSRFDNASLIMVYLAGVAVTAVRLGPGPSALAAALAVAAFDFFFVPPHLTFAVADTQYVVTFVVMLAVSLLISRLATRARREAEEATQARLATEAERLRNILLSSVSHDLRTPLAALLGASSTLRREPDLDEATRRDLLETVEEETSRLDHLVTNLLDMTRLESAALPLCREWHPLEEVVGAALRRLDSSLAGWHVETSLPDDLPLVSADATLLEQVLVNLLDNAVKYAGERRALRVAAAAVDGVLEVEVSDEGPGLPPGDEERVFEKFYRGPSRARGFGLGLAICRAVVGLHGGRIWSERRRPRGTTFRFTLPASAAAPPPPPADAEEDTDGA